MDDWTATRDTLHMWTQIIGKIRMAHAPMVNHWWLAPDAAGRPGDERVPFTLPREVSPVHYFWGAVDLAVTRFSGRTAPTHPGGAPNCGDWVMEEGYSHELSSCGFWPGGGDEGAFYAYAYPEPDGFADHSVGPAGAFYGQENGQFLLPYEAVRTAPDPDAALMQFLHDTYRAAAEHGAWDRTTTRYDPTQWDHVR